MTVVGTLFCAPFTIYHKTTQPWVHSWISEDKKKNLLSIYQPTRAKIGDSGKAQLLHYESYQK